MIKNSFLLNLQLNFKSYYIHKDRLTMKFKMKEREIIKSLKYHRKEYKKPK